VVTISLPNVKTSLAQQLHGSKLPTDTQTSKLGKYSALTKCLQMHVQVQHLRFTKSIHLDRGSSKNLQLESSLGFLKTLLEVLN